MSLRESIIRGLVALENGDELDAVATLRRALAEHDAPQRPLRCPCCPRSFAVRDALDDHLAEMHEPR